MSMSPPLHAPARPAALAAAVLALPLTAAAGPPTLVDDFEDDAVGTLPGAPWRDVAELVADGTLAPPTAVVVTTSGPGGFATRAVRTIDHVGTSQGIHAPIAPGDRHALSVAVRIDDFGDAVGPTVWPLAAGFTFDASANDLNADPHAVIYAYRDRRWYLFVKPRVGSAPGVNAVIPAPLLDVGGWYRLELDADTSTGTFTGRVRDAVTGALLGARTVEVPDWDPEQNVYDAIAFYDGEYDVAGGRHGGVATIDDVAYVGPPRPCAADVDHDGAVGFDDLAAVLATWGPCPGCPGDVDADGAVGLSDLIAVLAAWGPCG